MEQSCLDCLYANYTHISFMIKDFNGQECRKCEHPNSAYSGEIVNDSIICKFYLDEKEYFFNQDRIEKINNIKLKTKFKRK